MMLQPSWNVLQIGNLNRSGKRHQLSGRREVGKLPVVRQ